MYHREDAVPVARDHLVEGGLVAILKAIHEQAVEGHFLSFGGHTFCLALMGIFLDCSQDLMKDSVCIGARYPAVNGGAKARGDISCKPMQLKPIFYPPSRNGGW